VKSQNILGMYSSGNLPILVSTIMVLTLCLGQVRNVGRVAGMKGRLQLYGGKPQNYACTYCTSIVLHHTVCFALLSLEFYTRVLVL
jgi:hypothetical protein